MATFDLSPDIPDSESNSRTVSQFRFALALAMLAALLGCVFYSVEKLAIPVGNRFARNPLELMVRCLGLAHFIIGWLFLLTSPRLRNIRAIRNISLGFLVGLGICFVFVQLGSLRNPYLYLLFYGLFLYHEVRDEAVIYQKIEGVSPSPLLNHFIKTIAFGFLFLLGLGNAIYQSFIAREPVPGIGLWLVAGCLGFVATVSALGLCRKNDECLIQLIQMHQPLIRVFSYLLLILLVSAPLGSIGFVVLLHVASWMVFVGREMATRNPQTEGGTGWSWYRNTQPGFLLLHLGLAGAILLLLFVRVHVWHRTGLVSDIFAESSFCYWAIIHICMSFWSSR